MHTTIRRYKMGSGEAADLAKKVEDEFAPQVKEIDGFSGYFLLDLGDSEICTISVFADKAGTDESTKKAADWVPEGLAEFEPSKPEVVEGDVLLSVTP